jgi:DNA-directed RNA polymerase subunit RPC12/RpoP
MDISFNCGTCGKDLVVDEAGAGITIDCPGCGKPVYVPSPAPPDQSGTPTRVEVKPTTQKAPPVLPAKTPASSSNRQTAWSLPPLTVKYGALRTIANICQFMAVPTAIIHVLLAFFLFNQADPLLAPVYGHVAIIPAAVTVVVGVLSMVSLFAIAESIRVFIAIEENTRAVRQMMEYELAYKYRPGTPPPKPPAVPSPSNQSPPPPSHVRFSSH